MGIGSRIRELRGKVSQEDFAKQIGVSKMTIGRWEREERLPGLEEIQKILSINPDVSADWLINGDGPKLRRSVDVGIRALRARLKEILVHAPINSRLSVGSETGVTPEIVQRFISGKAEPALDQLREMAKRARLDDWERLFPLDGAMLHSETESACFHAEECLSGDFALVPQYNVCASAGGGAVIESEQIVDHLAFKKKWLRGMGLQTDRLALVTAIGDSMRPTIQEGNLLLVDLNQVQVQDGAIYILRMDSTLVAKRLQRNIDGGIIVKSDNSDYSDLFVGPNELDKLNIVGKVVWAGRKM